MALAPRPNGDFHADTESDADVERYEKALEMEFYNNNNVPRMTMRDKWDYCVYVSEGRLQVNIARRSPPMEFGELSEFCEWLGKRKLPVVLSAYEYLSRTGSVVDFSDNRVDSRGVDLILNTLRNAFVPCVVLKAFRNLLDDKCVDAVIEYIHTQPVSCPLIGLHWSHNRISSEGALRLVQTIVRSGQYPTAVNRRPFWLRLELNEIERPEDIVESFRNRVTGSLDQHRGSWDQHSAFESGASVPKTVMCLLQDGLCSDPTCDHSESVIQAPYFLNQNQTGHFAERDAQLAANLSMAGFQSGLEKAQQSAYSLESSGQIYRQNLAAPSGADQYSLGPAKPSALMQFIEVVLEDPLEPLGLTLSIIAGKAPIVTSVTASSAAGLSNVRTGMVVRRANGVDLSLLSHSQTAELLKQRPLSLRIGLPERVAAAKPDARPRRQ